METAPFFIGIAGASASGKSVLANRLLRALTDSLGSSSIALLKEDSYYKANDSLSLAERERINYDHPNAFDHDLLIEHLDQLTQGQPIHVPTYDYALHNRTETTERLMPARIVIVEGILLFHDAAIRERLTTKVFIDTDSDICLMRRLTRDTEERGRTVESVLSQYQQSVRPMFLEFVQPSKEHADMIIPRGGKNPVVVDLLKAHLLERVHGR